MNQDWDIKPRGESCSACGRAFMDGEDFFSRLTFEEQGYVRRDLCPPCWEAATERSALSVWKSTFRLPPPPPAEPLKKETAESLLRQFMEKEDFSRVNAIYILSVMLERRRILVERDVRFREDGVKVRVYEHRKTGETFLIPDPQLRLSELEHVQQEVVALLEGNTSAS